MKTKTVDTLKKARALIARGWTQESHARNAKGESVDPWASDACAWCAVGAIRKADMDLNGSSSQRFLSLEFIADFADAIGLRLRADDRFDIGVLLTAWNDEPERTQTDVLRAFDLAITIAGGER